jgi:hypothetical protein
LGPDAFSNVVNRVNFTILSLNATLSSFGLSIFQDNGTSLYSSTITTSPSGGSIFVDVNTTNLHNNVTVNWFFTRGGFSTYSMNKTYFLAGAHTTPQGSLAWTLNFFPTVGTNPLTEALIALVVTAIIGGGFAIVAGTAGAAVAGLTVLGIFTLYGWLAWWLFIATTIIMFALFILRG